MFWKIVKFIEVGIDGIDEFVVVGIRG